ncbi:ribonuclease H-like domain-containing protein [Tanacetum coccineum]
MVKELVSDDKLEKKTVFPTVAKIELVRPKQQEKPVRKPVKLTAITIKGKEWQKAVNTARPNSAVVNVMRENQTSRNLMEDMLPLGEKPKEGKLLVKELLKLNNVLFTNNGCFVLSPDFKLADESYVLLKVPRKNNIYSVDMKNIVPKESLTCLVAKAALDESMLWHRRTLIEAARTMLDDSKLPTTFWVEYSKNRVLVVKPHNKTLYELFRGRTPALGFMRPFRCHVTILNTLDYLGKFDGKSDEGFFVGYSMNSDGPKWLFDIDVLTISRNYAPVVVGTNSNDFLCTEESIGACHSSKEIGSSQDYILMPLWKDGSLFDSSSKNASNDEPQPSRDNATLEATDFDFFGDETKVDMSNITTTYPIHSTPNTRIHKDHSLDHVIGDVQFGV